MNKYRIAIFASGSGTNAEKIIQYFKGHTSISVNLVLSNNPKAFVLTRAEQAGIPSRIFNRVEYTESEIVLEWLNERKITHIVLAGFLWLVPLYLIKAFPHRIINIHPALLPLFGGKGMFGMRVHEAVKASGATESGMTIHLVDENYDEGKIIFQSKCAIDKNCSPSDIASKVHLLEHEHYPRVIEEWILFPERF